MFWDRLLNGALICRIVGGEAMKFSWQRLKVALAQTILSLKPGKVPRSLRSILHASHKCKHSIIERLRIHEILYVTHRWNPHQFPIWNTTGDNLCHVPKGRRLRSPAKTSVGAMTQAIYKSLVHRLCGRITCNPSGVLHSGFLRLGVPGGARFARPVFWERP
jgi:hypothetical protein